MPDALWSYRNTNDTTEKKVFIEVEVSSKGIDRTADILLDLAQHGVTWYFVNMDTKKGCVSDACEGIGDVYGLSRAPSVTLLLV